MRMRTKCKMQSASAFVFTQPQKGPKGGIQAKLSLTMVRFRSQGGMTAFKTLYGSIQTNALEGAHPMRALEMKKEGREDNSYGFLDS
ncbi:unnamed protein product [Parascedosporium putredinis]|uniref:Uncharacterized protein n=1 Tax=Parascedosporium putredinis TaxID=1442378 RepID=A0A9P1MDC6_9PEZI|nr:unnamed protein product [Parascedosporium putredinis]CAI7998390.1 unnamed protein product [Parascedosporium putredinis]